MGVRSKICVQPSVVGLDQLDPLGLIERQPLFRFRAAWNVFYHTWCPAFFQRQARSREPVLSSSSHCIDIPAAGQDIERVDEPPLTLGAH